MICSLILLLQKAWVDNLKEVCKIYKFSCWVPGQKRNKAVVENLTEIAGLDGNNVRKIWDNLEAVLSFFKVPQYAKVLENYKLWRSIRTQLYNCSKKDDDLQKLQGDMDSFGKKFLELHEWARITPYLHIFIHHSVERIKRFGSLSLYSQQGFEAAHKLQKMIWERATSRGGANQSSIKQTIQYFYRQFLMKLMLEENVDLNPEK